ncbi:hypothetical protein BV898_07901 [Hypsibius exemplaris]|uniref:Transmembrane protein n=1 Tax=Hypsibius exemplaris TaxID=2072580 RepID=A0A1W0WRX7_HYPEX|nr:hypothetical protein BV898_07901 [Hypsibius exemplaris]
MSTWRSLGIPLRKRARKYLVLALLTVSVAVFCLPLTVFFGLVVWIPGFWVPEVFVVGTLLLLLPSRAGSDLFTLTFGEAAASVRFNLFEDPSVDPVRRPFRQLSSKILPSTQFEDPSVDSVRRPFRRLSSKILPSTQFEDPSVDPVRRSFRRPSSKILPSTQFEDPSVDPVRRPFREPL